jgi:hypothetical protein
MPRNVADAESLERPILSLKTDQQKRDDQRTVCKVEDDQGAQRVPGDAQDRRMFHLGNSKVSLSKNDIQLIDYRQAFFSMARRSSFPRAVSWIGNVRL